MGQCNMRELKPHLTFHFQTEKFDDQTSFVYCNFSIWKNIQFKNWNLLALSQGRTLAARIWHYTSQHEMISTPSAHQINDRTTFPCVQSQPQGFLWSKMWKIQVPVGSYQFGASSSSDALDLVAYITRPNLCYQEPTFNFRNSVL